MGMITQGIPPGIFSLHTFGVNPSVELSGDGDSIVFFLFSL